MKAAIILSAICLFLGLGTALGAAYALDKRAYSVFDAHSAGFNDGVAFARAQQEAMGKLGICTFAAMACPVKRGK